MYEIKTPPSLLINCVWHAVVEQDGVYTDAANEYWSLGFARHTNGSFSVDLFGPSLQPRTLDGHKGEEYWGVEFRAHITIKGVQKKSILNANVRLAVTGNYVNIGGQPYKIPMFDDLAAFTERLEADGVITSNDQVYRALQGDETGLSERSRQRHVVHATGLTKKQIEQLRRARQAYYLLQNGNSPTEAAMLAGYADQPHMTRSLKLLRGETPAHIIATHLEQAYIGGILQSRRM